VQRSYNKLKFAVLLAIFANNAYADDISDARISRLQKMLEDQQVQMKAMADELKVLQKQTSVVVTNRSTSVIEGKDINLEKAVNQGVKRRKPFTCE
jgi:hypothetical protein